MCVSCFFISCSYGETLFRFKVYDTCNTVSYSETNYKMSRTRVGRCMPNTTCPGMSCTRSYLKWRETNDLKIKNVLFTFESICWDAVIKNVHIKKCRSWPIKFEGGIIHSKIVNLLNRALKRNFKI